MKRVLLVRIRGRRKIRKELAYELLAAEFAPLSETRRELGATLKRDAALLGVWGLDYRKNSLVRACLLRIWERTAEILIRHLQVEAAAARGENVRLATKAQIVSEVRAASKEALATIIKNAHLFRRRRARITHLHGKKGKRAATQFD